MTVRDLNQIYDERFFADYSGTQVDDIRAAADGLYEVFAPKVVLDVGAGPGALVKRLRELGVDASGIDGSVHALTKADEDVRKHLSLVDFTDVTLGPIGKNLELLACMEVAEHVPEELSDMLVDKLCEACAPEGAIVLTAAAPGQGGHDHVNEKPLYYYWVDKFRARGFDVDNDKTLALKNKWSSITRMWWYGANVCVFRRKKESKTARTDLVSVIVPCFRQAEYLPVALASVQAQTYEHVELIVACGDEPSEKAASEYQSAHACDGLWKFRGPFRIMTGLDKGLADARNQAIAKSTGKYIACLDADDWWDPTYLEKVAGASPEGDVLSITTCDMQYFGDRTDYLVLGPYTEEKIKEACYLLVCSLYSRKLWELVGGYENAIFGYEDHDFWIKCSKHHPVVRKVGERLFNYRIHGDQGSSLCVRNDDVLKACMRLMHPEIYGPVRDEDLLALAASSKEARDKLLQRAEWFPVDRHAQRIKRVLEASIVLV